ncbi:MULTISPECIES: DUF4493 domain-containing protein [unclassified Carboxylicivirga]|uniref:DUF4493 domain-containing protein n=1 Tax=Carboxylicivirga TaxID=1628153 RepID=UPI003D344979
MKTKLLSIALGLAVFTACSNVEDEVTDTGMLELKCGVNTSVDLKATAAAPNVDDFVVTIKDGQEAVVETFDPFSSAPEQVELMAGAYTVSAYSETFTVPAFDMPVYGAEVQVDVLPGQHQTAALNCLQTNAGVAMLWTDEFKAAFTDFEAAVSQGSNALTYSKTETRTGYFAPGEVTVAITLGTAPDQATFSKTLTVNAREKVTVKPVQSDAGSGTLTIQITVNTDVTEREEIFIIGGGNGGGEPTVVTSINEDFQSGKDYDPANINGWSVAKVLGERDWQIRAFDGNLYAQASAHNGAAADYEYWLITPAIDMDAATNKILNFETAKAYWTATSSLEVFVMDGVDPTTANLEVLAPILAQESDADHTFIPSGDVDLSAQTGVKYIGFKYVAKGGASNSTTFRIDNFKFGVESSGGDNGGGTGTELLSEDFASAAGGTIVDASGTVWAGNENFPVIDRAYEAKGSVKLASSKAAGSMVSKALDLSGNGGAFTVSMKAKGWYAEDVEVIIEVGGIEKAATFTSTGKEGEFVSTSVNFTGGQANSTVTIKTSTRMYNGNEVPQRVFIDDVVISETK